MRKIKSIRSNGSKEKTINSFENKLEKEIRCSLVG